MGNSVISKSITYGGIILIVILLLLYITPLKKKIIKYDSNAVVKEGQIWIKDNPWLDSAINIPDTIRIIDVKNDIVLYELNGRLESDSINVITANSHLLK